MHINKENQNEKKILNTQYGVPLTEQAYSLTHGDYGTYIEGSHTYYHL